MKIGQRVDPHFFKKDGGVDKSFFEIVPLTDMFKNSNRKGFLKGLLYGLLPHTFCILFIVFSVIGATAGTVLFKKFLLIPNLMPILIGVSFIFATLSAFFFLKKNKALSLQGIGQRWKYLSILYGVTVAVNLLLFFVVFPNAARLSVKSPELASLELNNLFWLTLEVDIPCSGHMPLIIDELKKIDGVKTIDTEGFNLFKVGYDSSKTSQAEILSLDIFKEYKATPK